MNYLLPVNVMSKGVCVILGSHLQIFIPAVITGICSRYLSSGCPILASECHEE